MTDYIKGDHIDGDPFIRFDGCEVRISKRPDGEGYWVHVALDHERHNWHEGYGASQARVTDARADHVEKHASETSIADAVSDDTYHVALCIRPVPR